MITSIEHTLAQQIVDTIKDVCRHDINFIDRSGLIIASTDAARIGTFHEVGQKTAALGSALEVTADEPAAGIRQGINLPLYHEGRLLAVIGITGAPKEVRQFAYLAERITRLLIREAELDQHSRRQADKKQFLMQSLLQNEAANPDYLAKYLQEFQLDRNTGTRLLLLRLHGETASSALERQIQELFARSRILLFTFRYPRDFLAVIDEKNFALQAEALQAFAQTHAECLKLAVGKPAFLLQLRSSYESALIAMKSLEDSGQSYALFDDLTLELLLSAADPRARMEFLQKTIAPLSVPDRELLTVYFQADMSLSAAAEALFLHKNTLQYRLDRIARLCGLNPRRFRDAVLLYLALKL